MWPIEKVWGIILVMFFFFHSPNIQNVCYPRKNYKENRTLVSGLWNGLSTSKYINTVSFCGIQFHFEILLLFMLFFKKNLAGRIWCRNMQEIDQKYPTQFNRNYIKQGESYLKHLMCFVFFWIKIRLSSFWKRRPKFFRFVKFDPLGGFLPKCGQLWSKIDVFLTKGVP